MNSAPFIHRCLEIAALARGKVGINPLVGAVLVRDGEIIAEAFHGGFGLPHAERALLENFKDSIEPQDVLYVNLEPCCHHGKTPPCTDIIIERGVKHVVYGMEDPNPGVVGEGIETLRNAGVEVGGPIEPSLCQRLNRGFVSLQARGRPWITLKRAQTRSGAIANPDGSPLKITSREQDIWSHKNLRATHDAILVGVQTIIRDDPLLTVRYGSSENNNCDRPNPLRIVLDPNCEVPLESKVVTGALARGTAVVVASCDQSRKNELESRGVRVWEVLLDGDRFDWQELWKVLTTPRDDFHGITSILVEGGPKTWQSFREAGVVDEEVVLVGGVAGRVMACR